MASRQGGKKANLHHHRLDVSELVNGKAGKYRPRGNFRRPEWSLLRAPAQQRSSLVNDPHVVGGEVLDRSSKWKCKVPAGAPQSLEVRRRAFKLSFGLILGQSSQSEMAVGVVAKAHISQECELGALAHCRQGEVPTLRDPAELRAAIFSVDVDVRVQEGVKIAPAFLAFCGSFVKIPSKPGSLFRFLRANEEKPLHRRVKRGAGGNVFSRISVTVVEAEKQLRGRDGY